MRFILLIYIFLIPLMGKAQLSDSADFPVPVRSVYFYKGLIKKGKVQLPDSILSQLHFIDDLAALKIVDTTILYTGGSIGFIDRTGKIIVPFVYDTIVQHFKNGLAIAGVSNDYFNPSDISYGVSTKKGKLFKFKYKEIGTIEKGLIPVRDESGKWGFFSVSGKPLFTPFCQEFQIVSESRILVKENGKWGLLDIAGGILIPVTNKSIKQEGDKYEVEKFAKWEFVSVFDKTKVFETIGDSIVSESGFNKILFNGKWGIQKWDGTPITEFLFDSIQIYPDSLIVVQKSGRFAALDTKGKYLTGFDYFGMTVDSLGYIRVKKPSFKRYGLNVIQDTSVLWEGLLDNNGTKLIPAYYKSLGKVSQPNIYYSRGGDKYILGEIEENIISNSSLLIPFQSEEGKWGYLNLNNEIIIPANYVYAKGFINGFAEVITEQGVVIIDRQGKVVVAKEDVKPFKLGLARFIKIYKDSSGTKIEPFIILDKGNLNQTYTSYQKAGNNYVVGIENKYGLLDWTGKLILPVIYDSINYEDTLFAVTLNDQKGYVDSKGNFTMPLTNRYKIISPLQEGHAIIQKGNVYGFIDYMGNLRVSVQYKQVKPFSNGLAAVMINGKWGYIDVHENIIIQPNYADATMFKNGLGRVKTDRRWDFINKKGEKVSSTSYDEITELSDGKYLLMRSYRYGIADINGRELIGAKYDMAEDFGNGYIKVKKDAKYGLTDYQENIVFPFEYDQLLRYKKSRAFILKKNQPKGTIQVIDPSK